MVFMREQDGRLRVLDGQQRLATAIIIFSALRAWFAVGGVADTAHNLQYDFIGRTDYGEVTPQPKLALNLHNDETFQEFVVRERRLFSELSRVASAFQKRDRRGLS